VTEIVEARKPKEPTVLAEISGIVEIRAEKRRGKMTIVVRNEKSGMEKEHHVPQDKQLLVHAGDAVEAGDPLIDGPAIPQDILRIRGEETLQNYLLSEVQSVYRAQNVSINDKHLEVVIAQMLRKVKIENPGDSIFLPSEVVDKFAFRRENDRLAKSVKIHVVGDTDYREGEVVLKRELSEANDAVEEEGGEPAKGKRPKPAVATTLLLGITKASLSSESFISAASFQETTKVLTEAGLAGATDPLLGLKENVILGHLIPAGTGFKPYVHMQVDHKAEPLPIEEDKPADAFAALGDAATAMAAVPDVAPLIGAQVPVPAGGAEAVSESDPQESRPIATEVESSAGPARLPDSDSGEPDTPDADDSHAG
jgi:DNA-directed RNA polymerase subunit beta'